MRRKAWLLLAATGLAGIVLAVAKARSKAGILLLVGTQGSGPGQGVFAARLDERTGRLDGLGLAAEVERPTWLLADPVRSILYAVSEVGNAGDREGAVVSFAIDRERRGLRPIGQTGSGGGGATHLALDAQAGTLFVANFGGGTVAAIPAAPDGALAPFCSTQATIGSGPHRRQQGPHPHGVTLDPSATYLLVPDMGADRIFVYRYDATAKTLAPAEPGFVPLPAGSGPRLIVFGDRGFAYLLTELSAEVFVFRWDAEAGRLSQVASVALDAPGSEVSPSAAAITLCADGRFLYVSNRATHEMHVFAVHRRTGLLTEVQRIASGGLKPWAAELSPGGRWLIVANQGSDLLTVFSVERATGKLAATEGALSVPTPTTVALGGPIG